MDWHTYLLYCFSVWLALSIAGDNLVAGIYMVLLYAGMQDTSPTAFSPDAVTFAFAVIYVTVLLGRRVRSLFGERDDRML